MWNLSLNGLRLSGHLPMRPGETLSLTVTLPNVHRIDVSEAVVRSFRGQEFAVENVKVVQQIKEQKRENTEQLVRGSNEEIKSPANNI